MLLYSRSGRIKNRYEQQRPPCRAARCGNARDRVETHDNMRQTCGANHQCCGDKEDINFSLSSIGICVEAEFMTQSIEFVEQVFTGTVSSVPPKPI